MFRCPAQAATITKISHKIFGTAELDWQGQKTSEFNVVDEYADGLHTAMKQTAAARRYMDRTIFSSTCGIFL